MEQCCPLPSKDEERFAAQCKRSYALFLESKALLRHIKKLQDEDDPIIKLPQSRNYAIFRSGELDKHNGADVAD